MSPDVRRFGHCQGEASYWLHRAFRGLDWINERDKSWIYNEAIMEAKAVESKIGRELTTDEFWLFLSGFIHTLSNLRDQERMLNDDTWGRDDERGTDHDRHATPHPQ